MAVTPAPGQPDWELTRRWEYSLGLAPGYDTNVGFGGAGSGDFLVSPLADLGRVFPGPKGRLRVRGSGRGFVYRQETTWNRADGELSVDGTRSLATSSTLRGAFSAGLGHTDSNHILSEQGVVLSPSRTHVLEGSTDLDIQAGRRSTVRISGRLYYTDFVDPQLVDSLSTRASLSLGRHLSERNTLAVQYGAEYSRLGSSAVSQVGSLEWEGVLSRHSAVLVEGGISYTSAEVPQGLVNAWNPYGGVSFARELGRSRVILYARREVVPSFGIGGLRLADRFGLRVSVPVGRAWFDLEGSHVQRGATESSEQGRELSDEASFGLRKGVGRRCAIALEGHYRRRGPVGPTPAVDGLQAALVVSFSNPGAGGGGI